MIVQLLVIVRKRVVVKFNMGLFNCLRSPLHWKVIMKKEMEKQIVAHWVDLKRLVQYIVKDATLADDILQSGFIKAITTKAQPKSNSKILPWFKMILKGHVNKRV